MASLKDIKNLELAELKEALHKMDEPSYRAEQIFFWLYHRGSLEFAAMRNLSKKLVEKLKSKYYISGLELKQHLTSSDGAEKFLFRLADGKYIETVLIQAKNRKTVCLSTQVGCKFRCIFCASGRKGFVRDLTPSEIINQILYLQHRLRHRLTNYVFMGIGEPLDNIENLFKAIKIMNEPKGMAIGARRMTVSTCGIVPGIEKLGDLGKQINLSVSLHSVSDDQRSKLIPVNKRYPLEKLIKACERYITAVGRMITLEYILIDGENDSLKNAQKLAAIAKKLHAKINLIPYSKIAKQGFEAPSKSKIDTFVKELTEKGANATIRESKGLEIKAACGQLAGQA
ncbi:MAG: 23S rRNA (adenine(2503)-C(2))-methyltransferase RlmN [Candidatus Omnitrophica bacterium]|nr:23S rRNA (adenine(2503)-C(2))-methyltransferase RlmN [Candidatus Omnitrophota bacterium]